MDKTTKIKLKPGSPSETEIVKNLCCAGCYNAGRKRCTCRCGGAYHGLGSQTADIPPYSKDGALEIS